MNLRGLGIDPAQWQSFASLVQQIPGFEAFQADGAETPMDRALRYLSLVRLFDESLYTGVFRKVEPDLPPFEEVIARPELEPVPRAPGRYWLRDNAQARWKAAWEDHPGEEAGWCQRIYSWLETHGGAPTDLLQLLLHFDLNGARLLLEREYNRADALDEMPLCHALAEQVEAAIGDTPATQFSWEQAELAKFLTRYRARALFLTEIHRTARYYPRPDLEKAFGHVIKGAENRWILYLDAAGGMGKTTFIQRMIAHNLLKEPPFPLVARLDLDDLNVSALADAPWLIAIEIAAELEQQLSSRPFSAGSPSFLNQVEMFRPLLYRRTSNRASEFGAKEMEQLQVRARNEFSHWSRFQSCWHELSLELGPTNRPLIIFIDTLEEASLHYPDKFRKVLANLETLHSGMPLFRLVLSGRYRPEGEHFKEYDQTLKDQTSFVRLDPLKGDEPKEFIRELLTYWPDADVLTAMVESARGNPFKLSLLCEIVANKPNISAGELRDSKDADIAYLIYRVIDRIPADRELGLRWLLRYGAVPRRLTLSFVTTILQPLLIRALRGELESGNEDIPSEAERKAWLQREDADLNPGNLWNQLTKYASEHGWVSVDPKDSNTVSLHSEVVRPMRRLLKNQQQRGRTIYTRLNTESADYFAKMKLQQPERWVEYTVGEVFHRIEAGAGDPLEIMQKAFAEKGSHTDAKLRIELASEVIKPEGDFSDMPPTVLAWANYEAADAIAINGNFRYLPTDGRRPKLTSYLADACDLARDTSLKLPAAVWRWREFLDGVYPESRAAIFTYLGLSATDRSRYWLLLLDLFGQERLGQRTTVFLRNLTALFGNLIIRSDRIPYWVWKERYAASLIELGQYATAAAELRDSLAPAPTKSADDIDRMRSRRIRRALIQCMEWKEAEREIAQFPQGEKLAYRKHMFAAEIHLLRRNSWAALESAERLRDSAPYEAALIRGRATGQLLRVADATSAFGEALKIATETGQEYDIQRVQLEQARFHLFEAVLPLDPIPQRGVGTSGLQALVQAELELCRAWQLLETNPTAAGAAVQALVAPSYGPVIRARAALVALSWGVVEESSLGTVTRALGMLDTYNARLFLTAPPAFFDKPVNVGQAGRNLTIHMAPISDETGVHLAHLYAARFLRSIGREKKARAMLRKCKVTDPPTREELAMLRQYRKAGGTAEAVATWDALRDEPGLYFAAMVENAEIAIEGSNPSLARESLEAIAKMPEVEATLPSFALRRQKIAESLGLAAPLGSSLPGASASRAPAAPGVTENSGCLLISIEGERLLTVSPGRRGPSFISTVESDALAVLTSYSQELTPRRLIEHLVRNGEQTVADLAIPFLESGLLTREPGPVFLAATNPQLVAAPWELGLTDRPHWIVRVGSGSETGRVAELFRGALNPEELASLLSPAFYSLNPDPSVVFFATTPDLPPRVEAMAQRVGATAVPQLRGADVVCIVGAMAPNAPGVPVLTPAWTPGDVAGLIHRDSPSAFVVLCTPSAVSPSVVAEQILLRNQFAQALINRRGISGVLTGGPNFLDSLVRAVRSAPYLAAIPDILRQQRDPGRETPSGVAPLLQMTMRMADCSLFLCLDRPSL
jgi:hypothetical protein